jgi:branched-subunit amino acid transport protein
VRELLVLVAAGIGTYAMRALFFAGAASRPPAAVARVLPLVGPAVLAAITVPALLAPRGELSVAETVPALLAAGVAALLWRRTASMPVALFGGLGLWWLALLVGWTVGRVVPAASV